MRKSNPIRMCISCRTREPQQKLIRLQKDYNNLIRYSGEGRSFYLCTKCIEGQHITKIVAGRMKLDIKQVEEFFKELLENVKN